MDENESNENLINIEEKMQTIEQKDNALKRLDLSFKKHIELEEYKKSNLLSYWIKDFSEYHDMERTFDTTKLKTFKRGDIIKVNLGFNIGHELGGLHYCIVLTKHDNPYSDTLNVIPLSSAKNNKTYSDKNCINLGDEIYTLLDRKYHNDFEKVREEINLMSNLNKEEQRLRINQLSLKLDYLENVEKELKRMKHGTIALISQITTISKIRIFNTKNNILHGIKATNTTLNLIDTKIMELFTK